MRATAIMNLKGGVGKTTTAIHMAEILSSKHDARVLLIDCDPQCNLSQFYGVTSNASTDAVLINGNADYAKAAIRKTEAPGVDIIPGSAGLMGLDVSSMNGGRVKAYPLRFLVAELEREHAYDYVFFDCPPAFNAASAAALVASDDVLVPIKLDAFSIQGMVFLTQQIHAMRQINPKLRMAGVLPTMWYKSERISQAEDLLRQQSFNVFHHIRSSKAVDEMTYSGTIGKPTSGSTVDYKRFCRQYVRQSRGGQLNG